MNRVVVEVDASVHRELRKLAALNDLKLYELTNAILTDYLADEAKVKALIRRLKL
jgi:hypothetical protein